MSLQPIPNLLALCDARFRMNGLDPITGREKGAFSERTRNIPSLAAYCDGKITWAEYDQRPDRVQARYKNTNGEC